MRKNLFKLLLVVACFLLKDQLFAQCAGSAKYRYYYDITKVTVNSLNNASPSGSPQQLGYTDFTNLCGTGVSCTNITIGYQSPFSVSFNNLPGGTTYLAVYLWINGAFTQVFSGSAVYPVKTISSQLDLTKIPNSSAGPTRMRVMTSSAKISGPCDPAGGNVLGSLGEAEDYTVFLQAMDCSLSNFTINGPTDKTDPGNSPTNSVFNFNLCSGVPISLAAYRAQNNGVEALNYTWSPAPTSYLINYNNMTGLPIGSMITTTTNLVKSETFTVTANYTNGCPSVTKTVHLNIPTLSPPAVTMTLQIGTGCLNDPSNGWSINAYAPGATSYNYYYTNNCGAKGIVSTNGGIFLSAAGVNHYAPSGMVVATNNCATPSASTSYSYIFKGIDCGPAAADYQGPLCPANPNQDYQPTIGALQIGDVGGACPGCEGELDINGWFSENNIYSSSIMLYKQRIGASNGTSSDKVNVNVVGSEIAVENNTSESLSLCLVATDGRTIKSLNVGTGNSTINVQDVSTGMYILNMSGPDVFIRKKIILQ